MSRTKECVIPGMPKRDREGVIIGRTFIEVKIPTLGDPLEQLKRDNPGMRRQPKTTTNSRK